MIYLAYEEEQLMGAFTSKAMAAIWVGERDSREVAEVAIIDKTFAGLAVEYNQAYEG